MQNLTHVAPRPISKQFGPPGKEKHRQVWKDLRRRLSVLFLSWIFFTPCLKVRTRLEEKTVLDIKSREETPGAVVDLTPRSTPESDSSSPAGDEACTSSLGFDRSCECRTGRLRRGRWFIRQCVPSVYQLPLTYRTAPDFVETTCQQSTLVPHVECPWPHQKGLPPPQPCLIKWSPPF